MPAAIQLVVGLGNPGAQYETTRHNAGAWLVSALCQQYHLMLNAEKKFFGDYGKSNIDGAKVHFLVPTTFMNNSGQAVQAVMNFFKIPLNAVLVIHDELDIPPGRVKLKHSGGHAGHNGLRSIIQLCGGVDFWRLRLGIGHPGHRDKVSSFVLSAPNKSDRTKIDAAMVTASHIFPNLFAGEFDSAMRQLHTKE